MTSAYSQWRFFNMLCMYVPFTYEEKVFWSHPVESYFIVYHEDSCDKVNKIDVFTTVALRDLFDLYFSN
jgi:hypothetical protein